MPIKARAAKLAAAIEALRRDMPRSSVDGIAAGFAVPEQAERLGAELADVDILINNVGLFELKPFEEISADEWGRYFAVNTLSGALLAQQLMPGMLARGWGRIVFISSESDVSVPADMIHYGESAEASDWHHEVAFSVVTDCAIHPEDHVLVRSKYDPRYGTSAAYYDVAAEREDPADWAQLELSTDFKY